jgi:hypothetical protein
MPALERVPVVLNHLFGVMAGLVPAIPKGRKKDVDARDDGVPAAPRGGVSLRGHDAGEMVSISSECPLASVLLDSSGARLRVQFLQSVPLHANRHGERCRTGRKLACHLFQTWNRHLINTNHLSET